MHETTAPYRPLHFGPELPKTSLTGRSLAGLAMIAVAVTVSTYNPAASTSGALLVLASSVGLLVSGRLLTRQSQVLAALAPVFGIWLAIRSSPWLIPLDVVAAFGLLGLATGTSSNGWLDRYGIRDLARMPFVAISEALDSLGFVTRSLPETGASDRRRLATRVGVGSLLALPISALLAALLAAGDSAFAGLLGGFDLGSAIRPLFGLAAGLAIVRVAAGRDVLPQIAVRPWLGPVEALTVVAALSAVYALFAYAQVAASFGQTNQVLKSAADTKDWVHDGFFPLLWAAAITLLTLMTMDVVVNRATERQVRWFSAGTTVLVALTLVVVGVSVRRITVYADLYGPTMLRLYSLLFTLWIGLVFLLFAARALGVDFLRRWFATTCAAAGLVILLGLNVANPEAWVVRSDASDLARFDADYLTSLSDDAVPALVDLVAELPESRSDPLRNQLCGPAAGGSAPTGLSMNLSNRSAAESLSQLCDG